MSEHSGATTADPGGPPPLGVFQRLGSLFRTYAIPKDSIVVAPPFRRDDRNCFTMMVPPEWIADDTGQSEVVLLEDGQPLGPAHCNHDDIRTLGRGRYSHWAGKLYFSASDNTDPGSNGRIYAVRPPPGWKGTFRVPREDGAGETVVHRGPPADRLTPGDKLNVEWSVTEVDPALLRPLEGQAWSLPVPRDWPSDEHSLSTLMLLEDNRTLPHPHAGHDAIAREGQGRYSHWTGELRFSSSDGSDPRSNGRTYAIARAEALLFAHLPRPPVPEDGHCWVVADLPAEWTSDDAGTSRLALLEDGHLLGPAHAPHDELRAQGGGRYSHWGRQLLFSTSDGSDPTTNGRAYALVWLEDEAV